LSTSIRTRFLLRDLFAFPDFDTSIWFVPHGTANLEAIFPLFALTHHTSAPEELGFFPFRKEFLKGSPIPLFSSPDLICPREPLLLSRLRTGIRASRRDSALRPIFDPEMMRRVVNPFSRSRFCRRESSWRVGSGALSWNERSVDSGAIATICCPLFPLNDLLIPSARCFWRLRDLLHPSVLLSFSDS